MILRSKKLLLLPLLALCIALAMAAPAGAQGPSGPFATLQINFGRTPHWTGVPGTRVRVIRERERPEYDMFLFGGVYYVYREDHWYQSRRGRGTFIAIDDRAVPRELSRVPRNHWRNYPAGWNGRNGEGHDRGPLGRGRANQGRSGEDGHR